MSPNNSEGGRSGHSGATGPTSPEGKARSAANSLKHGLTSRADIVDESEKQEYEELKTALFEKIRPGSILELIACNDMLHAAWNLVRIRRMEDAYIARGPEALEKPEVRNALELLHRYHARHERSYYRARKDLEELQTGAAMRITLPIEAHRIFPPMADTMKIHTAKGTGEKVWTARDREELRQVLADREAVKSRREANEPGPEANMKQ